jgi:extradiol dioxygenase family protein
MTSPFHYAFLVRDLASTRRFYGELLGCREGRSAGTWVDFDFFGNQISAHVSSSSACNGDHGVVDGIEVPMPHFGAILSWDEFHALAARLRNAGAGFVIEPRLRFEGETSEQATMFLLDPSANAIEFKAFRHPGAMFSA